jgi:serine O-acetyltransferase
MLLDRVASPERLWSLSIALNKRGHRPLALLVKRLNALLYHNSLPVGAVVGSDVHLGHHSFGVIIHHNVVIGNRVRIWHHVTIAVRDYTNSPAKIIIEDDVNIGTNVVVINSFGKDLRIGRAARIGAGTVVTEDVPAGATVVSAPVRVLMDRSAKRLSAVGEAEAAAAAAAASDSPAQPHRDSALIDEDDVER